MKKGYALVLLIFLAAVPICARQSSYAVGSIPDELKRGANAIVRFDETTFIVKSEGIGSKRWNKAITIVNANAKDLAQFVIGYDKLQKVVSIKGAVYDENGKEVRKLKKADIQDYSAYDGFSVFSDNRLKYVDLTYAAYPYTAEIEVETALDGLLHYPSWVPISGPKLSLESSVFRVHIPDHLELRYRNQHVGEPTIATVGGRTSYQWKVNSHLAISREAFGPPFREIAPRVDLAPTKFEIEGYTGQMRSWKSFGLWINRLNQGLTDLPDETVREIRYLTAGASSIPEKVRIVYNYLQQNTRYVSVQIGIGGWKPFSANFVDEKGYGDCKALSNYTMAMLSELNIDSHYALVRAGSGARPLERDFPNASFNHAILCVPVESDTIWLECTSQTNPFGYSGKFTGDRDVLLATPEGGKIVHTPVYQQDVNLQKRIADVHIQPTGDATAAITTQFQGLQYENGSLMRMLNSSKEEQEKWILNKLDLPSFELVSFELENYRYRIPEARERLELKLRNFVPKSGKRIFLSVNLLNKASYIPPQIEERKTDIVLNFPYIDIDTIRYHVPDGYHVEYSPEPLEIKTAFGQYRAEVKVEQNLITYIREVRQEKGRFPASSYSEFRQYLRDKVKADKARVVLIKET